VTAPINPPRPFLTAEWRYLLMLNFEVDPALLLPLVPAGTTLDFWNHRTFISIVGFRFLHTRLRGIPIPFHRHFEEINLRFYTRRTLPNGEVRRGVTFIREIVPRLAIAKLARLRYNEPYITCPMNSTAPTMETDTPPRIDYSWKTPEGWAHIAATPIGQPDHVPENSEANFITEHYWGYTRQRNGTTLEYQVTHPRWKIWPTTSPSLSESAAHFYGPPFANLLKTPPSSTFLAAGSPIAVHLPRHIT
jgi:uncharacterized protein